MNPALLLPALVLGPLAAGAVVAVLPRAARTPAGLVSALATAALSGAVVLVLVLDGDGAVSVELAGWAPPLGIALRADGASAALLVLTAVVGVAVSVYAAAEPEVAGGPAFWPLWLALWSALNGVYVSGDLFNLYVALELLTLAAVALVALGGRKAAAPALRYLFVGVVGSLLFLLAVALVYAEAGTLDLVQAREAVEAGPVLTAVLGLTLVGMAAKMALWPLHAWLPVAHPAAPAAVSALLSALVVKAAVFVLWRVWFGLGAETDATVVLGAAAGVAGAVAVFWGGLMALRSTGLKQVVAYSTVAQMGYLALVLVLSDLGGPEDAITAGWIGGLTLVLAHGLAKAAMFLAAGTLARAYGSDRLESLHGAVTHMPMTVAALAVSGVSLAGLPPTFGFVAKWHLLLAALDRGEWWWVAVLLVGGLVTFGYTALMIRSTFNPPTSPPDPPATTVPWTLAVVPFTLAVASVALGVFSAGLVDLIAASTPGGGAVG